LHRDSSDPAQALRLQLGDAVRGGRGSFPATLVSGRHGIWAGAFQFSGVGLDRKISALSGGEKSRLAIARMLYNPPNFLVLDEPTSHLDLATKEMLVDALKDFEGTMIFVSHDRMFLRGLGSRVLELGGESGTDRNPTVYPGSYVEYVQKLGHEAPGIYS
jgi:ATPase subunit of ABC transporter with duplicated ATPase domains